MITGLYAGLLTFLYVVLAFRIIGIRRRQSIGLGDAGDLVLRRRIRAHGNFCEYAPLGIVLLALAEMTGPPGPLLHAIGLCLLCGRLLHAHGLSNNSEASIGRAAGMVLTFVALLAAAGLCLSGFVLAGLPTL